VLDVTLNASRQFTVLLDNSLPLIGPILGLLTGSASLTLIGYDFDR